MAFEYCHHFLGLHPGITKTVYLVASIFYWPTAYNDVAKLVRGCATCQKTKGPRADQIPHGSTFLPIMPYDCLSIDLITPGKQTKGGNKYVLTMICLTSKYGWFIPLKSREAKHIANAMITQVFRHFGTPRAVYHDRAGEFTSDLFKNVLKELGVKNFPITPYNPCSQGNVERLNRTLLQMLRAICLEYPVTWDEALPMCQSAYNSSYHRSLNNTPYFSFFYRDNHLPYDIIYPTTPHEDVGLRQCVKDAQKILEITRASIYNTQQHRLQNVNLNKQNFIEVGDLVFASMVHVNKKDHKILPKYSGPYRVISMKFNSSTLKSIRTG